MADLEIRLPSVFTSEPASDGLTSSLGEQTKFALGLNVGLQCLETKVEDRIGIDYYHVAGTLVKGMGSRSECSHRHLKQGEPQRLVLVGGILEE